MRLPASSQEGEIKELLEENLKTSREILRLNQKTRRYIMVGQVVSFLKLLLILVPIILGIIYLPPYIKELMATYQELLGPANDGFLGQIQFLQENLNEAQGLLK